jgi:uracil-DNA glycosylase family 4
MDELRADLSALIDSVYEGEKKVLVFGEGANCARVMMIGEAPGEREALEGHPFVGRAGKNLDEFMKASGLSRSNMYLTNVVKFRPTKVSPAGRVINRAPTQEEIALFLPFLKREIVLVKPQIIVTLGNVPLKALMSPSAVIGAMHGALLETPYGRLFPMYHPAAIIYNRSLRDAYAADMDTLSNLIKNS